MWQSKRLVILDDKQQEYHPLAHALDFSGEDCIRLTSGSWKKDIGETDQVLAIVIDSELVANSIEDIIHDITGWHAQMPIILYQGTLEAESITSEQAHLQVIAELSNEATQEQWLNALHMCQPGI